MTRAVVAGSGPSRVLGTGVILLSGSSHWIRCGCLLLCLLPVTAGAVVSDESFSEFDHIVTGFPLDGQHQQIKCEACHVDGELTGLPTQCDACHDNIISEGKPAKHLFTTAQCDACHTPEAWLAFAGVNHDEVRGECGDCHNGRTATGKTAAHMPATNVCRSCHATYSFRPAVYVDHQEVIGLCSFCHNDIIARGKSPAHVLTNRECSLCHSTRAWAPASLVVNDPIGTFDHTGITFGCISCHNNIDARGQPQGHVTTAPFCEACHQTAFWAPAFALDHSVITGSCSSAGCHESQPVGHITTTSRCEACHQSSAWIPAVFVDHNEVLGSCADCHTAPLTHMPATNQCQACHETTVFLPALRVDHSQVQGSCVSCHDGSWAPPRSGAHISATDQCQACHNTFSFVPAQQVDHAEVLGSCSSCHFADLPPGHVSFTGDCNQCHLTSAWLPAGIPDHAGFAGTGNCATCHGVTASGKNALHIDSTDVCDACHDVHPATWRPARFVDHAQVLGDCVVCHPLPANHINTTEMCDACHEPLPALWIPVLPAAVDHNQVIGPCESCHTQPVSHISTSNNCAACHDPGPIPWAPLPASAVDHLEVIGTCASCHALPVTHCPVSEDCGSCHVSSSWLTINGSCPAPPVTPVADPGGPYNSFFATFNFVGNVVAGTNPGNYPVEWFWDFGDGGTSILQNPSYTYAAIGTYSVSLTVTLVAPDGSRFSSVPAVTTATFSGMM